MTKSLIFFATYNEAGNVAPLLTAIGQYAPDADILVVDDSSADGTVEAIRALALPNVTILVRKGKLGLGTAHLLALTYAQHHAYEVVVTMDGDLSHDPVHLPALMGALDDGIDLSVGSRYMPGGSCDYEGYRLYVSKLGNIAARFLLGIKVHEFTTSFRAFRVAALKRINFGALLFGGYSFFMTMIFEATRRGLKVAETPIHFRERGYGTSKIPPLEVFRGMANLARLTWLRMFSLDRAAPLARFGSCESCGKAYTFLTTADTHTKTAASEADGLCVFCGFRKP